MENLIIAMCLIALAPVYVGLLASFFPKNPGRSGGSGLKNPPATPRRTQPPRMTFSVVALAQWDAQNLNGDMPQAYFFACPACTGGDLL